MANDDPTPQIISRKAAKAAGLLHYYTGEPCKYGHRCKRYVSSLGCFKCSEISRKKERAADPIRTRQYRKDWAIKNPEKERLSQKRSHAKWWGKNSTQINSDRRKDRAANPEVVRDKQRASVARRYAIDPSAMKARVAKWRANNPEKSKEVMRLAHERWVLRNPLAGRVRASMRRAMQRERGGYYTAEDVTRIFNMQRGRCGYCRVRLSKKFHVDHIVPLAREGSNECKNLQILCVKCNLTKSARDPIDHARTLGLLL